MDNEKRQASIAKRLVKYSSPKDEHGCIHWNGYSDKDGYGLLNVELESGGRPVRAHRLSYEQKNGQIPVGFFVLHKCDKPSCINPDHLFLGTPKDNVDDMMKKKRNRCGRKGMPGEKNPKAKLTEQQVKTIRCLAKTYKIKDIANMYGISVSNASRTINHVYWKNV